ncbi:MAG: endonuclease Q family protein [Nitrososphaerota archaeon]|nr:endonuclease Q family protein [Nitrososphaerales archaeon]MDW8044857.1 endonuclease Q family protein [Nitrososphaerota archaeon]
MRVFADLHIHSKYSAATSVNMDINTIVFYAMLKGLRLIGTGDITHPKWFKEVSELLIPDDDTNLLKLKEKPQLPIRFMITTEVATVYSDAGKIRKIHHLLLIPSLEVAAQVSDVLGRSGDLSIDGRPVLSLTSPELVEKMVQISKLIEIIPAHIWTPWWSILGANSGYDSIEECYADQVHHIHALETGLSSDPPMNWRVSKLDRYTLVSNSDSHSPHPYRLGREANIFELKELSYIEVLNAIRTKDPKRFLSTIETKPEYGKYHYSGHRDCEVSMSGIDAIKHGGKCPKCGKALTKGVEQRVEELADRPQGYILKDVPRFHHLLPLHEVIATVIGASNPSVKNVQSIYDNLIKAFGDEFSVMIFAPLAEIERVAGREMAIAIQAVREDSIKVIPGYDGLYGRIVIEPLQKKLL